MEVTAENIIKVLQLEPLPIEGGLFRQTYVSSEGIKKEHLPDRYDVDKPFGTAIYYLLTSEPNSFSALHMLPTDEIWHFYLGDPVEMLELHPDGSSRRQVLGQNILGGQMVQHVVPAGVWMAARVREGGTYALMGTTMAPGYTPEDYVGGERNELIERYPEEKNLIKQLTRT